MPSSPNQKGVNPATRYFHGGNRGLKVGEFILPASDTGQQSASDFGAQNIHRKDCVYVSTKQIDAQLFASGNQEPVVYEVEPDGELAPDPDCKSGVSFTCQRAKIIAIHEISGKNIKKARKALIAASHRRASGQGSM